MDLEKMHKKLKESTKGLKNKALAHSKIEHAERKALGEINAIAKKRRAEVVKRTKASKVKAKVELDKIMVSIASCELEFAAAIAEGTIGVEEMSKALQIKRDILAEVETLIEAESKPAETSKEEKQEEVQEEQAQEEQKEHQQAQGEHEQEEHEQEEQMQGGYEQEERVQEEHKQEEHKQEEQVISSDDYLDDDDLD